MLVQFFWGLRIPCRFLCSGTACFDREEDFLSDLTEAMIDLRDFLSDSFSSSISLNLAESMSDSDYVASRMSHVLFRLLNISRTLFAGA